MTVTGTLGHVGMDSVEPPAFVHSSNVATRQSDITRVALGVSLLDRIVLHRS